MLGGDDGESFGGLRGEGDGDPVCSFVDFDRAWIPVLFIRHSLVE